MQAWWSYIVVYVSSFGITTINNYKLSTFYQDFMTVFQDFDHFIIEMRHILKDISHSKCYSIIRNPLFC